MRSLYVVCLHVWIIKKNNQFSTSRKNRVICQKKPIWISCGALHSLCQSGRFKSVEWECRGSCTGKSALNYKTGREKCTEPESAGTKPHRRLGGVCLLHFLCQQAENVSFESRHASKCIGCSLPAVTSVMVTFIMNRGGGGGSNARCGGGNLQSNTESAEAEVELQTSVLCVQSNAQRAQIRTLSGR